MLMCCWMDEAEHLLCGVLYRNFNASCAGRKKKSLKRAKLLERRENGKLLCSVKYLRGSKKISMFDGGEGTGRVL